MIPKHHFMRRLLAVCSLILLTSLPAMAQQDAINKKAKEMTDSLAYLGLTDNQQTQVLQLNTTAAYSLASLHEKAKTDTSLKGSAMFKQVQAIMQTRNNGLKQVLTPDQMKNFQQHQAQRMAEVQTKMMDTQLDLTDAQVPQVYQVNLTAATKQLQIMQKMQDASKLEKIMLSKNLKAAGKEKDDAMKGLLSPDQFTKYLKSEEQMKAAMKEKKS